MKEFFLTNSNMAGKKSFISNNSWEKIQANKERNWLMGQIKDFCTVLIVEEDKSFCFV